MTVTASVPGGDAPTPLPPLTLVFVYGLLRPGHAGHREHGLSHAADWIGADALPGTLYDLGAYPGAVIGGGGTIRGEILDVRDAATLARLDAYEGYDPRDPAGSEYVRVRATTLQRGLNVWIYVYNRDPGDAALVPDGEWLLG